MISFFIKLNSRPICIPMRVNGELSVNFRRYFYVLTDRNDHCIPIDGMICGLSYAYSYHIGGTTYYLRSNVVKHSRGYDSVHGHAVGGDHMTT
jgi:hypothetical protein